jgi:hypothetical protein
LVDYGFKSIYYRELIQFKVKMKMKLTATIIINYYPEFPAIYYRSSFFGKRAYMLCDGGARG